MLLFHNEHKREFDVISVLVLLCYVERMVKPIDFFLYIFHQRRG